MNRAKHRFAWDSDIRGNRCTRSRREIPRFAGIRLQDLREKVREMLPKRLVTDIVGVSPLGMINAWTGSFTYDLESCRCINFNPCTRNGTFADEPRCG